MAGGVGTPYITQKRDGRSRGERRQTIDFSLFSSCGT
jgi:hypothetical protein